MTRDAAICEAPTFRPTSSSFLAFFGLAGFDGRPAFGFLFGRLKSSESLISLLRSTTAYTSPARRRPPAGPTSSEKGDGAPDGAWLSVQPERSSRPIS